MPKVLLLTLLVIGLPLLFSPGVAHADEQQPPASTPAPLTLHQCIEAALGHQSDVLVGQNNVVAAKARSVQAKAGYFPQVTVQSTKGFIATKKSNSVDNDGTSLQLTQNIYDGGLREAKVANAAFAKKQYDATLIRTQQTVVDTVTKAYLELLRAQGLADVADQRVAYIEGQQKMIKARVEAGDAAEVDVFPIDAQLANAHVDQLTAKNTVRTSAIQLQKSMGFIPTESFAVAAVAFPEKISVPKLEECLTIAQQQRPEILEAKAGIDVAKSSVKVAKINMYPRPVITAQFDQLLSTNSDQSYGINAGIVYDIFNGKSLKAAYQEATADLSSAEIRAAQTPKDINAEVQNAHVNITNAAERMKASAISVTSAKKNLAAQEERYQQGLAIPLDLLNAQLEVTTAENSAVEAQYDYLEALTELHYAMGSKGEVTWEK
ncbi:MAG TPA: TolC family protein [Armatimonadota bacterium]|nr:TolC family protein [Armatimonadota bacterium]